MTEQSNEAPELLPCRFCGKESKGEWDGPYVHVSGAPGTLQFYSIVCNGCCSTVCYERRKDAVNKWNTRARVPSGGAGADSLKRARQIIDVVVNSPCVIETRFFSQQEAADALEAQVAKLLVAATPILTSEPSDLVLEARALLAKASRIHALNDSDPAADEDVSWIVSAMADEIERLRRGDFTSDEFQNLCHNTKIQDGFEAFADGCEAYQQKMFGRCRTKGKVL